MLSKHSHQTLFSAAMPALHAANAAGMQRGQRHSTSPAASHHHSTHKAAYVQCRHYKQYFRHIGLVSGYANR
jgi:hypothetical protein